MEITLLGSFSDHTLEELDILFSSKLIPDYRNTLIEIKYSSDHIILTIKNYGANYRKECQCIVTILHMISTVINLNQEIANIMVGYRNIDSCTFNVIKETLIHFPLHNMELFRQK